MKGRDGFSFLVEAFNVIYKTLISLQFKVINVFNVIRIFPQKKKLWTLHPEFFLINYFLLDVEDDDT